MKIPSFRNTSRLVKFVRKFHGGKRLPRDKEQVFFTTKKEVPAIVAKNLADYINMAAGRVEVEFENLLKADPESIIQYARHLHYAYNETISEDLEDALKGQSCQLYQLACLRQIRLHPRLEDTFSDPYWALKYATDVVKGRLPSHLEPVFFQSARFASEYAFDVIRGFAPVKLPDELHSFMIMQSYANPDDHHIKIYMQASESDPNKSGNSVKTV